MTIRALIVDDEPLARKRVAGFLKEMPDVSVIGECGAGREAIQCIRQHSPDLLFLDIQMPEVSGFDVLQAIGGGKMPVVIFTTAYDQHALKAFEVHALDYLLKPFSRQRFSEAVARAREQIAKPNNRESDSGIAVLIEKLRSEQTHLSRFVVKSSNRLTFVKVTDVDWIESASNYALLHAGNQTHLIRETMQALEKKLCPKSFQRISRSAIVNLSRVKELQPMGKGEYVLILEGGKRLTMSRGIRDLERALGAL
ncbi:MAG: LytTR family DNA-binding domain-containing protein [Verrucomicrobiota bacterium]|jgi:two-component system LytT family response regulator